MKGTESRYTYASLEEERRASYRGQSEVVYDRHLKDRALQWMRENPLDFLSSTGRRISHFWVINPAHGWESSLRLAVVGPLILLVLYAFYFCRRCCWQFAPL